MIVRILGEGLYELPDPDLPVVEEIDDVLMDAVDRGDEAAFTGALADLIGEVRHSGTRLAHDDVRSSGMVVPHEGSSLAEVKALLAEEGG
ncbi:MAG TPA: hypothetical protein VK386_03275 [Acidimicrobiales bacterium]|nr:hypothetical protein [Acidimicrobiales bacterium]